MAAGSRERIFIFTRFLDVRLGSCLHGCHTYSESVLASPAPIRWMVLLPRYPAIMVLDNTHSRYSDSKCHKRQLPRNSTS